MVGATSGRPGVNSERDITDARALSRWAVQSALRGLDGGGATTRRHDRAMNGWTPSYG